jgi:hypothetical protein
MIASSKRFTKLSTYAFSLAAYATFDGGQTWIESPLTLPSGAAGTSDPAITWDSLGIAYLVALPFKQGTPTNNAGDMIGIAVYRSTDEGRSWSDPVLIHSSSGDDKQWVLGDVNPTSPHCGNVYAVWDNGNGLGASKLAFARTTDHGSTWKGIKIDGADRPPGTPLPRGNVNSQISDSGSPELSVAADGSIYIVWWNGGTQIKYVKSADGGDSFSDPKIAASGISPIPGKIPGGKFRTQALPTGCTGIGNNVVFAWSDFREGVSRIYYRHSTDGGTNWHGLISGEPLLTGQVVSRPDQHEFQPQLISTPSGQIGCSFYEFGPKNSDASRPPLIDVIFAFSTDNGRTFSYRKTVTDISWDPALNAPLARGDPTTTFIGDYFGLDASRLGFFPLWTDTRTGMQELFIAGLNEILIYSLKKIFIDKGIPFPVSIRRVAQDLGLSPPITIKELVQRLL